MDSVITQSTLTIMPNFSEINSVSSADSILRAATPAYVKVNAMYVAGDHFQRGTQWIGPPLPPEQFAAAMASLLKSWVPVPVVEEMIDGHVAGVVGREPAFEMLLLRALLDGEEYSAVELAAKAAIDSAIGDWWDKRGALSIIQEWTARLRYAERATLRLFVPPDLLVEDGDSWKLSVPQGADSLQNALDSIYFEAPPVESAVVYQDRRSMRECGLYRYDEKTTAANGARAVTKKRAELVFVTSEDREKGIEAGQTMLRIYEDKTLLIEVRINLGGFNLMHEGRAPLLITEPVKANQRALNMTNTMLPLNAAYAGFRKQDFVNVKPPTDPNTGEEIEMPSGPGQIGMWYSAPYVDGDGKTQHYPPVLITTEPVNSDSLRKDIEHYDRIIRRACKQEHTLYSGGDVSAVALIQMRARFANDLLRTTPVVEAALRWLQPALWCFALYLADRESEIEAFLEEFRPLAQCKPYTGPLTPDEIRVLIELVKEGLMSRELAQVLFGVEDVQGEIDRLKSDMGDNLVTQQQRGELFTTWAQTFDAATAAKLAGLSEEQVALILKQNKEVQK